jgi:SAM-dependent methyltransferase
LQIFVKSFILTPQGMRDSIRQYARIVAETIPLAGPIYEFGALRLEGFEETADLRPFFPGKEYEGCDMRPGLGVDKVLNLHDIDLPSGSVGAVLSLDTLEHVQFPHRALEEIHRILKPDGIVVLSTVLDFRIHDSPSDYWRFTPDGLKSLLQPFASCCVGSAGRRSFPHTVVALGFKGATPSLDKYIEELSKWEIRWERPKGRSWKDSAYLFLPPILKGLDRRIARGLRKKNER